MTYKPPRRDFAVDKDEAQVLYDALMLADEALGYIDEPIDEEQETINKLLERLPYVECIRGGHKWDKIANNDYDKEIDERLLLFTDYDRKHHPDEKTEEELNDYWMAYVASTLTDDEGWFVLLKYDNSYLRVCSECAISEVRDNNGHIKVVHHA